MHRDRKWNGDCQRPGGRRDEELLFNGYRVSIWDDEEVMERYGDDGCTTLGMNIMPLNCT